MSTTDTKTPSPLLSVAALLMSVAFLIMGNGLQLMLLPIRGELEGFSEFQIGLLGSGYFLGFVLGCLIGPKIIARAGHIRAFAALVAIASSVALGYPLAVDPILWVVLRLITGFCLSGLYLVVESWLNDRATNETRGTLFSVYVAITFTVIVLGQMTVTLFQPSSFILFSIGSILVSLAAVPVVMTRSTQPPPITFVRFRPVRLFQLSPAGAVSVFMIGLTTGAFWSLAPTFASRLSGSVTTAALFMSAAVLGGALAQWPVGKLSDTFDRRYVIIGLSAFAAFSGVVLSLMPALDILGLIVALLFGAGLLTSYAIATAHVFDYADRSEYVEVSAGLLLLNGLGSTLGPLIASFGMSVAGQQALFWVNAIIQILLIAFVVSRMRRRDTLSEAEKHNFDFATTAPVVMIGEDEEAVMMSDLVVEQPVEQAPEPEPAEAAPDPRGF
ncbi:MFS transporter [Devosia pacifica]|uniref:MFS transporter n=1 Tax=Devosia pacifica TaxID=1335967 RepID=A0A918VUI0_9HYPH|nr:MFS transporter [Devosia pacifica]GHA26825.1 MFS transporter [Devosia pacifica]